MLQIVHGHWPRQRPTVGSVGAAAGRRRISIMIGLGLLLILLWVAPSPAQPTPTDPASASPRPSTMPAPAPEPPLLLARPTSSVPAVDPQVERELAADRQAGVLDDTVPPGGAGVFNVVAGLAPAPGPGPVRQVRVEVEGALPIDAAAFAEFVMVTLNDPRGWGRDGAATFARTDGPGDIVVMLASPQAIEQLCQPRRIEGMVSCRTGNRAVLNFYRWVLGQPDFYGRDRTGYRQYVINHEVGHVFERVHEQCPGPGLPAPVMQQQTLGLQGCLPNPWPYP